MTAVLLMSIIARRNWRRERMLRDESQVLDTKSDSELIARYRLPRDEILHLTELVRYHVERPTTRCNPIPPHIQVLSLCYLHLLDISLYWHFALLCLSTSQCCEWYIVSHPSVVLLSRKCYKSNNILYSSSIHRSTWLSCRHKKREGGIVYHVKHVRSQREVYTIYSKYNVRAMWQYLLRFIENKYEVPVSMMFLINVY